MNALSGENFKKAIQLVNSRGFAAIDLAGELPEELGAKLYQAMDAATFHPDRLKYYNELAFYWPEDWADVDQGIGSFHEAKSLKHILPYSRALSLMRKHFGEQLTHAVTGFALQIKRSITSSHFGLANNELRLARVIIRQMSEQETTTHGGSGWHEDSGYSDRPYQQLLSVVITTYGVPTTAHRHTAKVGELLIFNAFDRRRLLGLPDEAAFIHKGPKSGPKMFFFFEFLGPRL